jgi:P-type E1-E2 ATPase
MLEIRVPDLGTLRLAHLVLDFNGTLARDGMLLDGVGERLDRLAKALRIHVVTGDTFGRAGEQLAGLPCELTVLAAEGQSLAKRAYVEKLGPASTACIGNGRNDRLMLEAAALGIVVVQHEGAAIAALQAARVAVVRVTDALDLLLEPLRLVATLRG